MNTVEMVLSERDLIRDTVRLSSKLRIMHRYDGTYLVVCNDEMSIFTVAAIIDAYGRKCIPVHNAQQAKIVIRIEDEKNISCVVLDMSIGKNDGHELLQWLKVNCPMIPIVVLVDYQADADELSEIFPTMTIRVKSVIELHELAADFGVASDKDTAIA